MLIIFFQKDAITYIYILTKLEFSTPQKYRKANITKYFTKCLMCAIRKIQICTVGNFPVSTTLSSIAIYNNRYKEHL